MEMDASEFRRQPESVSRQEIKRCKSIKTLNKVHSQCSIKATFTIEWLHEWGRIITSMVDVALVWKRVIVLLLIRGLCQLRVRYLYKSSKGLVDDDEERERKKEDLRQAHRGRKPFSYLDSSLRP